MGLIISSFAILILLSIARSPFARRKKIHIIMMQLVLLLDIGLVLYLTFFHHVFADFQKKISPLLIVHICLSLFVVVGYIFSAIWGRALAKGDERFRKKMILADRIIFPARILVSITILILKLNA